MPLALAVALIARLCVVFAARVAYPYDLEWMEGGMLAHAWRMQRGLPIYTVPGPEWIPFIYPPGYAALLATVGEITGLSPTTGRALSLIGTAATASAIAWTVGRQGRNAMIGVLGAAVYLGTYPNGGAFFDLVRNESIATALVAWAVAIALEPRRGAPAASGLLLCAAFLVKHNCAWFGLPLVIGLWARDRGAAARFVAASAIPALAAVAWLEWRTDGRFLTYLLVVPAAHGLVGPRGFPGTPWELGLALPFAVLAGAACAATQISDRRAVRALLSVAVLAAVLAKEAGAGAFGAPITQIKLWWLFRPLAELGLPHVDGIPSAGPLGSSLAIGSIVVGLGAMVLARLGPDARAIGLVVGTAIVGSALMRAHHGGFVNVHLPMFYAVALGGAFGLARLRERFPGPIGAGVPPVLLAAQLIWAHLALHEAELEPTAADRDTGDQVVAILRDQTGPVLSPFAPWLPTYAGHDPSFHLIALWDVDVRQHPSTPFPGVTSAIERAMIAHRWGTVVDATRSMQYGARDGYAKTANLPGNAGVFAPKTGWRTRPTAVLSPK